MKFVNVFCENVENMIEWMKEYREEALERRDVIEEYLVSNYFTIQQLLGFSESNEVVLERIRLEVKRKFRELENSLEYGREARLY